MSETARSYDLAALLERRIDGLEAATAAILREHGQAITELRAAVSALTEAVRRLRPGLELETKRCAHFPPSATKFVQ